MFNRISDFVKTFWDTPRSITVLSKEENDMRVTIVPVANHFGIKNARTGELIREYSRARDARRGANRLGYTVV